MKICFLLHFYQPYNQQEDILLRIVNECYLPLTRGLLEHPRAKVTININAALTEMLSEKGFSEVVENIKKLTERGQIELTGSAKYHAFLPLLPEPEIIRQININSKTNKKYIGDLYKPEGFFVPEMAVSPEITKVVNKEGFSWMSVPQVSFAEGNISASKLYKDKDTGISLMFRNKRVSSLILSGVCRDADDLIKETQDIAGDTYWFCVMDAETFGHHRIGHEKFLFEILDHPYFEPILVSDLLKENMPIEEVSTRASTWTNEEQDFWLDKEKNVPTDAKSFILWKDPENPIHTLQWELLELASDAVNNYSNKNDINWHNARDLLDRAESSDQFWWASAKPWWSLEMIEQGAYALKNVLSTLDPKSSNVTKAEELYKKILAQAFEWQRSGYIRKKHLENSATYMKAPFKDRAPAEWYNQMILEFEDEMNKAAQRKDFEKAIKWRDAIIKMHNGTDMYDILHVVDELWTARRIPSVKPYLDHKPGELSDYIKPYLH